MIIFVCPVSGLPQQSDIQTSQRELARLGKLKLSLWCAHCKAPHSIMANELSASLPEGGPRAANSLTDAPSNRKG